MSFPRPGSSRSAVQVLCSLALLATVGCGGGQSSGGRDAVSGADSQVSFDATPAPVQPGEHTYLLSESLPELPLWTTPCTRKVTIADLPPEEEASGLQLHAARNEFEPVQLVVGPGTGTVSVDVAPFASLGSGQCVEVARVGFVEGWAETLSPLGPGETVDLDSGHGTPIWLTVYVPPDAPAGEHTTSLVLGYAGEEVTVPVTLNVFDFALPSAVGFATQLNVSVSGLIPEGGDVDDAKTLLFEHRFTPKSVTWPSGFRWGITWENERSDHRCEPPLWDEPDEGEPYSIGHLAPRYILGTGWNETGFPNAMIFQFVNNSTPRPDSLCGISRGDHYGTQEYNAEWSQYLGAVETYLRDHGMLAKAYYYVQNEPQNDEDHRLAAHLCRLTKAAAPDLRIAISEEPKPEIAEDAGGACGYDIWIAHVRSYQRGYAWERQRDHGEEVWLYSLDHDPDPYFNPTRHDVQGIHQRIIPWVCWRERARGWAYYDAGRFFDGPRPTIRAELLREGIEDYEYLLLANEGAPPTVVDRAPVDETVDSVAAGLTTWTRDPDALMSLRRELGRYIEGSRETVPVLAAGSDLRPRGTYLLNFQDPAGAPAGTPLVVEEETWEKVGWEAYDAGTGIGWYGENVGNPGIAKYGYDDVAGYSDVQRSYLYDDYGRDALFELDLENGRYAVTIGVGRPRRGYPNDPHNASIEGIPVVVDAITTDAAPTIEETVEVELTDGKLSLEIGGRSELNGNWSYTFLAYLRVEPVD